MLDEHEINNRFGFHKATLEGVDATKPKHAGLREAFMDFAEHLNGVLPEGRYKELMLDDLERASMWSHKSIAQTAPLETDR